MVIEIDLSDKDISKCKQFARDVVNETYNRFNRSVDDRIERLFFGKLGEVAMLQVLNSKGINPEVKEMFDIYPGTTNVDSFDFITKKKEKIDVKTAYKNFHTRILIPYDQFENIPKDFYVGVKIDIDKKKAVIFGYCTNKRLKENGKKDFGEGPAYWEDLNKLKDINELIALVG